MSSESGEERALHEQVVAHHNVVLLRTREPGGVDALLADPEMRGMIWMRLDDRQALVDPSRVGRLRSRLTRLGHHPLFSEQLDGNP